MCSCNDKVSRCHVGERQESLGSMNDPFLGEGGREGIRTVGGALSHNQHLSHGSHRNSNNTFAQTHMLPTKQKSHVQKHTFHL